MKIKLKIMIFLFLIISLLCTTVKAVIGPVYSDKLHVTISNINDKIKKIELLTVENCIPSKIFEYEIVKQYGYYYDENNEIPIWDKSEIVKDKEDDRVEYYKGKYAYSSEEEVRLYQVKDYDKSKYILINSIQKGSYIRNDGINYEVYYDSNKNLFTLYRIESTNEIENYKINNGKFELLLKDLIKYGKQRENQNGTYMPNLYLRFYKDNMEYKDIALGNNSIIKTGTTADILIVSKEIDYQTGKFLHIEDSSKFDYLKSVNRIVWICITILFIIAILSIARKIRKKRSI